MAAAKKITKRREIPQGSANRESSRLAPDDTQRLSDVIAAEIVKTSAGEHGPASGMAARR
ncbi:hypothetical protein [Bradyrhizobium sp.]|uniref:hypothetical protein n=1 Tax=Bradyrhizobium sp. TaxID=376 RepID=UPI003C47C5B2